VARRRTAGRGWPARGDVAIGACNADRRAVGKCRVRDATARSTRAGGDGVAQRAAQKLRSEGIALLGAAVGSGAVVSRVESCGVVSHPSRQQSDGG
jgi:hypothetical protein